MQGLCRVRGLVDAGGNEEGGWMSRSARFDCDTPMPAIRLLFVCVCMLCVADGSQEKFLPLTPNPTQNLNLHAASGFALNNFGYYYYSATQWDKAQDKLEKSISRNPYQACGAEALRGWA